MFDTPQTNIPRIWNKLFHDSLYLVVNRIVLVKSLE